MAVLGTEWLDVPTIYKAYFSGPFFREYPNSYGQKYGTFTYLHLLDPEDLPLMLPGQVPSGWPSYSSQPGAMTRTRDNQGWELG